MYAISKFLLSPLLVVSLSASPALPQLTTSFARIVDKIDEDQLVTLKGNTPPAANMKNDQGRVNPNMRMSDLILVVKRSPEQQATFDAFVASQYDATSPNYHRWLEPSEVGEKFGPSLNDIATISSWLASHELSVDGVSPDRMAIRFSGSAGRVQAAFHTEIHKLSLNGEPHFANMTDPQIPMALEPVVVGPKALHNFVPRPLHRLGGKARLNTETGTWERLPGTSPFELRAFAANVNPQPELGSRQGSGTSAYVIEDLTPYDFATIYNVLPLWSDSIDGTGQTIAVAGRSDVRSTDVASFRSIFGLPAGTFNTIHNGPDPGYCTGTSGLCTLLDQVENALDVEWAGAVAKGSTIDLVVTQQTETNDAVYESASYVIVNKIAPILSVSYGLCELYLGTSANAAYNSLWQTAATQGIAVLVASGDAGSPACDQGLTATTPYGAQLGLSVNGLASTPFNSAVGGTDFTWCNPTASALCTSGSPYWNAMSNTSTGANAVGYIPEVPWNDTCTTPAGIAYIKSAATVTGLGAVTDAESACSFIKNNYVTIYSRYGVDLSFFVYVQGAGGGASSCTTSDRSMVASCAGGYDKPVWQAAVAGIPNDGKRDLPDISFFAGVGRWNSAYLICVSDAGTCLTNTSPANRPTGQEVGGTSVGTPAMAGVMALVNQKTGAAQGNPNAALYQLAAKQAYSSCKSENGSTSNGCYFNDVGTGTNAMPCTVGSLNCTASTTGNTIGVLSGYGATTGYDMASGLGTLNVANIVNAWPSPSGMVTPTVMVTSASTSIKVNDVLSVSVSVQGASGAPTGTVTLSGGGFRSSPQTLSSGSTVFTIPANSLSIGTDTLTASYSGDSTYATASGTTIVTVAAASKLTPTITTTPASPSISRDQVLNVVVAVSGSGATPTGTVTLAAGGYTSPKAMLVAGGASFTIPANALNAGAVALTVSYGGDATYLSGTSTTSVTVSKVTPILTISPGSTSIHVGQSLDVTVIVSGPAEPPTGTVMLSGGGYTSAEQAISAGRYIFTIPPGALTLGSHSLTIVYSGDGVYLSSSASTDLSVSASTFGLAASTPPAIIRGGSATSTITVSSNDGYAGRVTLTCLLTVSPAGATHLPTCSVRPESSIVTLTSLISSGTGEVIVATTSATAALVRQGMGAWAASGAAVALLILFVLPRRNCRWRAILGTLTLMILLGSVAACGRSGNTENSGGGGGGDSGTTVGIYTFAVTGIGSPALSPTPTASFSITVN